MRWFVVIVSFALAGVPRAAAQESEDPVRPEPTAISGPDLSAFQVSLAPESERLADAQRTLSSLAPALREQAGKLTQAREAFEGARVSANPEAEAQARAQWLSEVVIVLGGIGGALDGALAHQDQVAVDLEKFGTAVQIAVQAIAFQRGQAGQKLALADAQVRALQRDADRRHGELVANGASERELRRAAIDGYNQIQDAATDAALERQTIAFLDGRRNRWDGANSRIAALQEGAMLTYPALARFRRVVGNHAENLRGVVADEAAFREGLGEIAAVFAGADEMFRVADSLGGDLGSIWPLFDDDVLPSVPAFPGLPDFERWFQGLSGKEREDEVGTGQSARTETQP